MLVLLLNVCKCKIWSVGRGDDFIVLASNGD